MADRGVLDGGSFSENESEVKERETFIDSRLKSEARKEPVPYVLPMLANIENGIGSGVPKS